MSSKYSRIIIKKTQDIGLLSHREDLLSTKSTSIIISELVGAKI